mmetsp:Transcript_26685/g.36709  ORF Transcript_26685/g.36709 Transcript_26685/m.36709 type:complete len:86 (-) Transcript_26685:144-401(-)
MFVYDILKVGQTCCPAGTCCTYSNLYWSDCQPSNKCAGTPIVTSTVPPSFKPTLSPTSYPTAVLSSSPSKPSVRPTINPTKSPTK